MSTDLSKYKTYRKVGEQLMRPYVSNEDMKNISIAITDTPEVGRMIAINPKDVKDSWYVAKTFFEDNYELVQ